MFVSDHDGSSQLSVRQCRNWGDQLIFDVLTCVWWDNRDDKDLWGEHECVSAAALTVELSVAFWRVNECRPAGCVFGGLRATPQTAAQPLFVFTRLENRFHSARKHPRSVFPFQWRKTVHHTGSLCLDQLIFFMLFTSSQIKSSLKHLRYILCFMYCEYLCISNPGSSKFKKK